MSEMFLAQDEAWPTYYLEEPVPCMKEDRRWSHYVIDVPDELADRYKSAFAEWEQVQNELHLRFLALHREATLIEKSTRVEPVPAGAVRRFCDALGYDWRTLTSLIIEPDAVTVWTVHPVTRDGT